jgi:hypothetical protein
MEINRIELQRTRMKYTQQKLNRLMPFDEWCRTVNPPRNPPRRYTSSCASRWNASSNGQKPVPADSKERRIPPAGGLEHPADGSDRPGLDAFHLGPRRLKR